MSKKQSKIAFYYLFLFIPIFSIAPCAYSAEIAEVLSQNRLASSGEKLQTPFEKSSYFTKYQEMVDFLEKIAESNKNISIEEAGTSQRYNTPIYLVTIDNKKIPDDKKLKVMIIARAHGSEPAGMEAIISFVRDMACKKNSRTTNYLENFTFYIIPCLNPNGAGDALESYEKIGGFWGRSGRGNLSETDINRDYQALKSSEARACVGVFNRVSPDVVFDLHEFSSIPVIVTSHAWWMSDCFDILLGAGRNPDVYPPLAKYAREICDKKVFPILKSRGTRAFYYAGPYGDLGSMKNMGVTAADYFNLRNAMTFLIETSAYDQGLKTLDKRLDWQQQTLMIILDELAGNKKKVKSLVDKSREFARERDSITLEMKTIPVNVKINGKDSSTHTFKARVGINNKPYEWDQKIEFKDGNPDEREFLDLPGGYIVIGPHVDYINRLMLHGINVYESLKVIRSQSATIPAHVFYIPQNQESSAIIGLVLDRKAIIKNRYCLMERMLVMPVEIPVDLKNFRKIKSKDEISGVILRFNEFMGNLMKNMGVEDKTED
ncbi:MAG: hypothetical protein K8T10_09885 [Candidatus Eremiobacteraeota bacterium]|nr:hypothetical protein [Candidatus Eremiobacteraeota bacterium]